MRNIKPLALALAALLAAPVYAGSAINGTAAINPDGRLEVQNVRGHVQIRVWDKNQVEVHGTLGAGSTFELKGSGASVTAEVKNGEDSHSWLSWGSNGPREDTRLEITVPRAVSPEVHVVSSDVDIAGLEGGRAVTVESVSGDTRVEAKGERLELKSVSGDMHFSGAAKRARLESVSGDITAEGIDGDIALETVSGDMRLRAHGISELKANSVSGDMELEGALAAHGRIKAETMSGDVHVNLAGEVSAAIDADTFSGSIRSDFGSVDREHHGPGERLRAKAGNGDGQIELKSFSGDLSIRKR
jgi:DUF4097 and DUF4098 domain-containing protein YvlB